MVADTAAEEVPTLAPPPSNFVFLILLIFNAPLAAIVAACIAANAISQGPVLVVNAPANAVAIPVNIWIVAEAICNFFDFSKPSLLVWSCCSAIPSKIPVTNCEVAANVLLISFVTFRA